MEPSFLLQLAETNLARGDLSASAAALDAVLERLDPSQGPRAMEVLQRLRGAAPAGDAALAERLGRIGARLRGQAAPGPAPAPASGAGEASSGTIEVLRRIASSPGQLQALRSLVPAGSDPEPALPVLEVVGRLLATELDVGETARVALDLVARAVGARRAFLILADAAGTSFGLPGGPDRPPPASQTVLAEVARRRTTLLIGDATRDPRFAGSESVQALELRAVLATPLLHGGGLEGVLWLEGSPGRFGPAQQQVVESLAALAAPGLARAREASATRAALARSERLLQAERAATRRLSEPLLLGRSPAIQALRALLERVAASDATVLIEGESGTGKELAARELHALGPRAEGPFVAENLGALSDTLAEDELFGHVAGAFTGAQDDREGLFQLASGGTLLLDEVGEASTTLQAKLLRVLEQREVRPLGGAVAIPFDARVVAVTNRDLAAEVAAGRFREDLLFRLAVVRIRMPALRERPEDVPLLLEHFLSRAAADLGRAPPRLEPGLVRTLQDHAWPGNVRELQAWAQRHVLTGDVELQGPGEVEAGPLSIRLEVGASPPEMREARAAFDRVYLARILEHVGGNVSAAARLLGVNRSHLSTLISRYRLR